MDSYIKEWLALENIVTKPFNKRYLEPLLPDTKDKCLEEIDKVCELRNNNNCKIYITTTNDQLCVTKTRIKSFQATETAPLIVGKNRKSYRLMSTVKFDENIDSAEIYYYIFLSLSTNNIYILFPTGVVFTNDEFKNIKLKSFLQQLINEILKEDLSSDQKIIICGHSMGCVLSLYTGIIIQQTDENFFNSKIIIIGSAPFKYSNDSLFTFSYLHNVKIFAFCIIKENEAFIDCFVVQGPNNFNYNPLTYFTKDYKDNNSYLIDDINTYTLFALQEGCDFIHSWENYYSVLTKIYPFTKFIVKTGGMRSLKPRRKRTRTLKNTKSRK
jgi:hypothetical protein